MPNQPEVQPFVPSFKQCQEIATATGLDENVLSGVVLGLQSINVVFAQVKQPPKEEIDGNITELRKSEPKLK
jgi:hypothetical protein